MRTLLDAEWGDPRGYSPFGLALRRELADVGIRSLTRFEQPARPTGTWTMQLEYPEITADVALRFLHGIQDHGLRKALDVQRISHDTITFRLDLDLDLDQRMP